MKPGKKGYEAIATPVKYGRNGRHSFFVNESGEIRAADKKGETANASDPLDVTPEEIEAVAAATEAASAASDAAVATPTRPRRRKR